MVHVGVLVEVLVVVEVTHDQVQDCCSSWVGP
jgi:hypothetical protein